MAVKVAAILSQEILHLKIHYHFTFFRRTNLRGKNGFTFAEDQTKFPSMLQFVRYIFQEMKFIILVSGTVKPAYNN